MNIHRLAVACLLLSAAGPTPAADFLVDTTSDQLLSACTAAPVDCSLRGAITAANATTAEDRITFDIPAGDAGFQAATAHWRILVSSTALPAIAENLEIDGYTQPGAIENTLTPAQGGSNAVLKIELRNGLGNSVNGIDSFSNNFNVRLVLRGLAINSFNSQVLLGGAAAHRIEGCFLGTTIDGVAAATSVNSNRIGVRVQGPGPYLIGGLDPSSRNLISGDADGIAFFAASDGLRIQGNLIGTNAAGTQALSPRATGISIPEVRNLLIGGSDPAAANLISGNGFGGIRLSGGSSLLNGFTGTRILGNRIGTDWSGRRAIGNGLNPFSPSQTLPNVSLSRLERCDLQVGGQGPGEANLIAYAGDAGIAVSTCRDVEVQHNRFIGNRTVPIDLHLGGGFVGATPNDAGDGDTGGNRLQNYPEIVLPVDFAPVGGSSTTVRYRVDSSIANATYPLRIEFHRAGCGGGPVALLGSAMYLAADAQTEVESTLTAADGGNVLPLVAVAVDANGNVSEVGPVIGENIFQDGFGDAVPAATNTRCN